MEYQAPTTSTLLGKLLVAAPDQADSVFDHAMVLVIEHSERGAIGLVVNQLSLTGTDELAPEWNSLVSEPSVLFAGGPIDHDALITLGRTANLDGDLVLGLHSIDLDDQPDMVESSGIEEIRIFSGYVGWLEGQLEDEVMFESWWVFEPRVEDIFASDPSESWQKVLMRQPEPYSWYANFPDMVRAN